MSDSDCSNCDFEKCEYRDFSYNCYKKYAKIIKRDFSQKEINKLISVVKLLKEKEDINGEFFGIFNQIEQEILKPFYEELSDD